MSSKAFDAFQKSMKNYGWYQYREGEGYDIAALRQVTSEEAEQVIDQMEAAPSPDWVVVEVLDNIGTDRCLKLLKKWTTTQGVTCRMCALSALHKRKLVDDIYAENLIITALSETTIVNGMTNVLDWAKRMRTTKVKRKVLWCALHCHEDIRVHCAALAHFLYGVTKESFDMGRRDFYLQFRNPKTARLAYRQLCIDVNDIGSN